MAWWDQFNGTFWITITTILTGVIALSIKMCVKSKCASFSCFGVKCIRDTQAEEQEHEFDANRGLPADP